MYICIYYMYVLYVFIILPFIAHLSFQNFLIFYITAHIHKMHVYMYTYVYIHMYDPRNPSSKGTKLSQKFEFLGLGESAISRRWSRCVVGSVVPPGLNRAVDTKFYPIHRGGAMPNFWLFRFRAFEAFRALSRKFLRAHGGPSPFLFLLGFNCWGAARACLAFLGDFPELCRWSVSEPSWANSRP